LQALSLSLIQALSLSINLEPLSLSRNLSRALSLSINLSTDFAVSLCPEPVYQLINLFRQFCRGLVGNAGNLFFAVEKDRFLAAGDFPDFGNFAQDGQHKFKHAKI
jgi:hypothetical protein